MPAGCGGRIATSAEAFRERLAAQAGGEEAGDERVSCPKRIDHRDRQSVHPGGAFHRRCDAARRAARRVDATARTSLVATARA